MESQLRNSIEFMFHETWSAHPFVFNSNGFTKLSFIFHETDYAKEVSLVISPPVS